jgi:hypothetical protein
MGSLGHGTDQCFSLRHAIQNLIDKRLLNFQKEGKAVVYPPKKHVSITEAGSSRKRATHKKRGFEPSQFITQPRARIRVHLEGHGETPEVNMLYPGIRPPLRNNPDLHNVISFSDDELPPEGTGHNKALHIAVKCREMIVARVLIDNGSALNVCPLAAISKLGVDRASIRPCSTTIRAFDGSKRQVQVEVDLHVEIGPHTFEITFQVLDIPAAYNFLLGRPWVHSAGAVPSSLHQSLKYVIKDHLVTVHAEEDLMVLQSSGIPFIDIENDLAPDAFLPFKSYRCRRDSYPQAQDS